MRSKLKEDRAFRHRNFGHEKKQGVDETRWNEGNIILKKHINAFIVKVHGGRQLADGIVNRDTQLVKLGRIGFERS